MPSNLEAELTTYRAMAPIGVDRGHFAILTALRQLHRTIPESLWLLEMYHADRTLEAGACTRLEQLPGLTLEALWADADGQSKVKDPQLSGELPIWLRLCQILGHLSEAVDDALFMRDRTQADYFATRMIEVLVAAKIRVKQPRVEA